MTNFIVLVTVLVSIAALYNSSLMNRFIFNPYMVTERGQWYRFISSGFIHADWLHLLVNMFVLWSFGQVVEGYYRVLFDEKGFAYYSLLYIGALFVSIAPSYLRNKHNAGYNALGASGAVAAVLFAAILFRPLDKIYFYGLIGLPGIVVGIVYLVYSYYMNKRGGDFINHDAHFWGAVYGALFTIMIKPSIFLHFLDQLTQF
jgi:membrane associated rhomboid family serine protease